MAPPVERFVLANGLRHHVLLWGEPSRSRILLCHGYLDMAFSFARMAERLAAAGHRVLAFDWRGHGETEWVGAGGYYHFPDYVLDLEELFDVLELDGAHLVGHSMGGAAAAMFAGARPARVQTLTLLEGLGPPDVPADHAPERLAKFLAGATKVRRAPGRRVLASVDEALARMRIQNPDIDDSLGLELAARATELVDGGPGRVWRFDPLHRTRSPLGFRADVFSALLRRVTAPTLLVHAEHGMRVPDEDARARCLARHELVWIPGAGHMLHWTAPEEVARLVGAFVARPEHAGPVRPVGLHG